MTRVWSEYEQAFVDEDELVQIPDDLEESIIDEQLEPDYEPEPEVRHFRAGELSVPYKPGIGPVIEYQRSKRWLNHRDYESGSR